MTPVEILAKEKAQQNRAAIDPWTAVHVASGLAMGLMGVPLRWALPVAAAYEVAEQRVERTDWGQGIFRTAGPESLANVVVDLAVFAAGHQLGALWNRTG